MASEKRPDETMEGYTIRLIQEEERERCARLVPTNWCDPLLTGPKAPKLPLGAREVEALLRGIQDRIRGAAVTNG